jgi:hypothetical protein
MYKNTSPTVEGLADSDSSGPLPTSVCLPHNISPLDYNEHILKTNLNPSSEVKVHP